MAKSLEEHLYRSAQSKEEYLDMSTLKQCLQTIAHGLELHRSNSSGSNKLGDSSSQQEQHHSGHNYMSGQQQVQRPQSAPGTQSSCAASKCRMTAA